MALGTDLPTSFKGILQLVEQALARGRELAARGVVRSEAEQIVIAAYRNVEGRALSRAELYSRLRDRYPEKAAERAWIHACARSEGKPLQHLLGFQAFLDHEYEVGPDVLIPRPETEILVIKALEALKGVESGKPLSGLEVGLGSGAISIELLSALPGLRMKASEVSEPARARAAGNARRILGEKCGQLEILAALSTTEVWEPFDRARGRAEPGLDRTPPSTRPRFLISNPPYLTPGDGIDPEVRKHEPSIALFAPSDDPLHFYRKIASGARRRLATDADLFLELPHQRASEIQVLFQQLNFATTLSNDLNGRPRVLHAKVPSRP